MRRCTSIIWFAVAAAASSFAVAQPADHILDPADPVGLFDDRPWARPAVASEGQGTATPIVFNDMDVSECVSNPAAFRNKIAARLPLGAKRDDLDNVMECKKRAASNAKFATCIGRVEAYLEYELDNRLGTTPGGADIHGQKASFPAELRDQALFEALDGAALQDRASLEKVRKALDGINRKTSSDWVMAWFAGHVDSVGVVPFGIFGEMSSYGRIMMYSAAQATWANFVISMSDQGIGPSPVNVSILKVADNVTYFQDHTRQTSNLSVTRAGGTGNGIKCGQCHATGFLKAYPLPKIPISDAAYDVIATDLGNVNAVSAHRAPFANHLVSVFGGVTVGDATGARCNDDEDLAKAAKCATCHKVDGSRGPLYLGTMSRDVIERYVTAGGGHGGGNNGHMPPSASNASIWTVEKRKRLFACLKDDYESRFRAWLTAEPCN
jgi:hypothetical protein